MSRKDFEDGLVCGALMQADALRQGRCVTIADVEAEANAKFPATARWTYSEPPPDTEIRPGSQFCPPLIPGMTMAKFRKKPVVIDAFQWTGDWGALDAWVHSVAGGDVKELTETLVGTIRIETLEGAMAASRGDWIIRGVKGEFYPCKPDIFAVTYEPVAD